MRHKRAGRLARIVRIVRPTKRWATGQTTAEGRKPFKVEDCRFEEPWHEDLPRPRGLP